MKNYYLALLLLIICHTIFSQEKTDTIFLPKIEKDTLFVAKDSIKKPIEEVLFSDEDLNTIDSLLIEEKFEQSDLPYTVDLINWEECDKDFKAVIRKNMIPLQRQPDKFA